MRKFLVVMLVALMCAAPGAGLLQLAVSAPVGGGFQADAVSAASPNYRVFSESDLKSMKQITHDPVTDEVTENVWGGHYTCNKNSDPYSYFEQDWEGVDLSYLLEQEVGIKADTTGVKIIAADGYAVTLSLAEMQGNGNPDGLKTLLGYNRGVESAYNPPNDEGTMDGTGTFPSVDPVVPNILLDANEGPFRLVMPQSVIGPDARNAAYSPVGAGTANWQKAVRQVRAIEVQPLQPGIPAIDAAAIPENQVVVYGNIENRHTFTVDQLKSMDQFTGTYHYRKTNSTPPPAYFEEDHVCAGVTVAYLLDEVLGLQDTADGILVNCWDGYNRTFTLDEIRQLGLNDLQFLLCLNYDGADPGIEPDGKGPVYMVKPLMTSDPTETNNKYWMKSVRSIQVNTTTDPGPDPTMIPTDRIIVSGLADAGNIPNEWFLAEGCTGYGFEEWILIENPNPWETHVIVDYMIEGSTTPVTLDYDVPAESRFSINVAAQEGVGADLNVSARVEGYHGDSIVVERAMYWGSRDGGHCSGGIQQPLDTWYLAEGATNSPFETWVLVQNPNATDVTVDMTLMTTDGEQNPPGLQGLVVPANSRKSYNLGEYVQTYDVSTKVAASGDVVVERAMYWNERDGGHCAGGVAGPGNAWYLAEGATSAPFETWVLVQNPSAVPVNIDMDLITSEGVVQGPQEALAANSRKSYNLLSYVDTFDVSTKVAADGAGVIVERAMYWNERDGGHCESASDSGKFEAFLAEGATAGTFETWVLFQNPGTVNATVYVTYLTDEGVILKDPFVVPAGTRQSVNLFNDVGEKYDVSVSVDSSAPIVVERAVYWDGRIEGSCAKGLSAW